MVPVAYAPNNDLYVSADQGGFEITNVHPGNNVYTELVLRQNWSSSGKSLLGIVVATGPRITGIRGFITWPEEDCVNHNEISNNVEVYFENKQVYPKINVSDKNGSSNDFEAVNGKIDIPASYLVNAIENHVELQLWVKNIRDSKIVSLPQQESENFLLNGAIAKNGALQESSDYKATDFADVDFATDIAYQGVQSVGWVCLAAYNENQEFVKILLERSTNESKVYHFTPDGTYKYVRACALASSVKQLTIYYRTRG